MTYDDINNILFEIMEYVEKEKCQVDTNYFHPDTNVRFFIVKKYKEWIIDNNDFYKFLFDDRSPWYFLTEKISFHFRITGSRRKAVACLLNEPIKTKKLYSAIKNVKAFL